MTLAQKYGGWLLLLFHGIGLFLFIQNPENASMTYLNILLCGVVLYLAESKHLNALFPLIVIFIGGYLVEYVGVHTGIFFGDYQYGDSLGIKVNGIPLIIGINWYAIVVSSAAVARNFSKNTLTQIVMTAILCTLMDYLIEPVAIRYDFWNWNGDIPLSNYIWWFVFSIVFAAVYIYSSRNKNRPGEMLWMIWVVFFILLNWIR